VALLLRSAEIQPPSHDLFDWFLPRNPIPLVHLLRDGYRVNWPAPPDKAPAVCPSASTRATLAPGVESAS